jgi:hypothetical protein
MCYGKKTRTRKGGQRKKRGGGLLRVTSAPEFSHSITSCSAASMASQSNPDQSGPTRRPAVLQEMPSRANVNVSKISEPLQMMKVGSIKNANFPMDAEGRVYHIGVKFGEGWRRFFFVLLRPISLFNSYLPIILLFLCSFRI